VSEEYKGIGLNHFLEIMKYKGKNKSQFSVGENITYKEKLFNALNNYAFSDSRKMEVLGGVIALRIKQIEKNIANERFFYFTRRRT
jgi:hypothetical protein